MSETIDHSLDLPLMSNIDARHVYHYILDLRCNFKQNIFAGSITLFSKYNENNKDAVAEELIKVNKQEKTTLNELDKVDRIISAEVCLEENTIINVHDQDEMTIPKTSNKEERSVFNDHAEEEKIVPNEVNQWEVTTGISDELDEGVNSTSDEFVLVLDSWDITVEKVEELTTSTHSNLNDDTFLKELDQIELNRTLDESQKCLLNFSSEKRCVKVWKTAESHAKDFPQIVKIFYHTRPSGESLKWTKNIAERPWVYTHGHWINNRSLFPSQDIPQAMASWRAYIHAPKQLTVLMTGEVNAETWEIDKGYTTHYFYSKMEMPSSTLALAVGYWKEVINEPKIDKKGLTENQSEDSVPFRMFVAPCHSKVKVIQERVYPYIPKCIWAACQLLGPYPFYKLDILIVPESFHSLGMASPSLMFVSQSVLSEDGEMLVRIAHEVSHSWFGIIIGPKDWTEEWLSEGFCTYTEGIIHSNALQPVETIVPYMNNPWQNTAQEGKQRRELLDYMRYKNLQAELSVADTDLQTLRPNKDAQFVEEDGVSYVKNGMNPDKGFMQLHYLKGYFLLCFLESIVGLDSMCLYLKKIVDTFHHQLVNSKDVLMVFMEMFPEKCEGKITLDYICEEWLDNPGMPKFITVYIESIPANEMFRTVSDNVSLINEQNTFYTALHWSKKRRMDWDSALTLNQMNSTQVLLMLDMLVNEDKLHCDILKFLNNRLLLSEGNADILHKWCEMVVKFKGREFYGTVKAFLIDHQAMGVYLFGELILSRDKDQRKVAESAFDDIKDELDAGVYKTICLMIYGTETI